MHAVGIIAYTFIRMGMISYSSIREKKNKLSTGFFKSIEDQKWDELDGLLNEVFTLFIGKSDFLSKTEFISFCKEVVPAFAGLKIKTENVYEEDELIKGKFTITGKQERAFNVRMLSDKMIYSKEKHISFHPEKFELWIEENTIFALTIEPYYIRSCIQLFQSRNAEERSRS